MNHKKTMIIFLLALLLSSTGVYFAYYYIQQVTQIKPDQSQNLAGSQSLVVVGLPQTTPQGTVILANLIKPLTVPLAATLGGDYVHWSDRKFVLGQRLLLSLPSGAGIQYSDLISAELSVFSDKLSPGERAMTIPVDPLNSIYGFLQPQDKIDILLVTSKAQKIQVILQNIEVLATDFLLSTNLTDLTMPNSGQIKTLTLRVSLEQAQTLTLAGRKGSLQILLRNKDDHLQIKSKRIHKPRHIRNKQPIEIIIGGAV